MSHGLFDSKTCCKQYLAEEGGVCPHAFGLICDGFADPDQAGTNASSRQADHESSAATPVDHPRTD